MLGGYKDGKETKGYHGAEGEYPRKDKLRRRSDLTGDGTVVAHCVVEKFAGL